MRFRWLWIPLLLLATLWLLYLLLRLDPLRTGLAVLLLYGGYRLVWGSRLTGVVHLMDREYHLKGIDLSSAITDVKIDLSRAIIPAGEQQITIRGLIGNVDIYVPYDLEVAVTAAVPLGKRSLIDGSSGSFVTRGYADAATKVKIAVSLAVGDVTVRYL